MIERWKNAVLSTVEIVFLLLQSGYRSVRENLGLAFFSLALAFIVWIVVTDAENPRVTGIVNAQIPVIPVNVPDGYVAPDQLGTVQVAVRAREGVLEELTAIDFEAKADLSGLTDQQALVSVTVEVTEREDEVRVTGVTPDRIPVTLDREARQTLAVEVEYSSDPPVGFRAEENPAISPETVEVVGTADLVSRVDSVVAVVALSGATSDLTEIRVGLVARDRSGALIDGVRLIPDSVTMTVAIEQELFRRDIEIQPNIQGEPAEGYNISSITISPSNFVSAIGTRQVLDSVRVLTTRPVDVSGARSEVVRSVEINPVANLQLQTQTVTVTIGIEPAQGQAEFGVVPRIDNVGSGLDARVVTPMIRVRLSGPVPVLAALAPTDLDVSVDASGLGEGSHTLPVTVVPPEGTELAAMSPGEIIVSITPR